MKFNEKIKALRKASDMNQQELADKRQINVTHLSKIENGHWFAPLLILCND
ncbi:MAG: helix-turn-helix transcriptional regulator [Bacteroidota bacterium]|nr:helix-turn-helix transcriptional regulator [Bacteroidota bacterium]